MILCYNKFVIFAVAPLAGVWIEIIWIKGRRINTQSLPLRECGLKFPLQVQSHLYAYVAPLAGVWIEIMLDIDVAHALFVAPLAGVWIEITIG